jgi:hypothetical protein
LRRGCSSPQQRYNKLQCGTVHRNTHTTKSRESDMLSRRVLPPRTRK